jgi:hypothetical protein
MSCYRPEVGVITGREFLSKSLFYEGHFPGGIKTIQVGNFGNSTGKEIILLSGDYGFIFNESSKNLEKTIKFKESLGIRPEVLNIKNDGSMTIMLRGGGFDPVGLVNELGEFIWKYNSVGTSPLMTSGDLDKDGELELYVADKDGLHRLNYLGKEIWKTNFWEEYVNIYDSQKKEIPLVVTRSLDGKIRFYNSQGKLIKEVMPSVPIYNLEIINWPDDYCILSNT